MSLHSTEIKFDVVAEYSGNNLIINNMINCLIYKIHFTTVKNALHSSSSHFVRPKENQLSVTVN